HLPEVKAASDALAPGVGGAALLLLAQLAYIRNAIIWAVAYPLGPGFAFGTGTVVAPTGSALGAVPVFPMLAALPTGIGRPGGPGWVPIAVLALPYLAGIFAGVVTVRIAPTPVFEAAPLWGFAAGASAGLAAGLAAAFAGGPPRHRPPAPPRSRGGLGAYPAARHPRRATRVRGKLPHLAPPPAQAPRGRPGRPAPSPGPATTAGPA